MIFYSMMGGGKGVGNGAVHVEAMSRGRATAVHPSKERGTDP